MKMRKLIAAISLGLAAPLAAQPASAPIPDIAAIAPPPPDYATAAAWSSGPFGPGPAVSVPQGATPLARNPAVDVFYVHPTTSRSRDVWNQDVADAAENRWADESVVARQASAFNHCCRVFSPRYRAATAKAFTSPVGRDAAFALAFSDIERAFDWYLAHENKGRPFIIAGHSQGAFHMATLLERRIDGTPLQNRMVAAYIIGINLAEGDFGRRYKVAKPCARPDDTGCVLQWQAFLASSDISKAAGYSQSTFVAQYGDVPGKQSICLNPLTFDARRPAAPARRALGAVPGDPGFGLVRPLLRGKVAARCEQGLLVVDVDPALELKPLPGGSMHYHDFGLFYADIRADAARRARAFGRHGRRHK
jgi:Protein of unknown function (DUF3089)